ncbi:protease pro-enzyme activation domain-containing protein [Streptacidiphilus sp. P02-A3a]|uniref:S53 family peptidase n=1 Tax=Streptacidiphilus sp. P02-A3a TaxID=2704468 RepID=UPI0015FC3EB6|nr:S53 family peptidase [Streptacidiphilus sp. P02-A3a]QMU72297.1 hypothetical protein GXP74_32705 [Streptacidiphilus sp. P02-A3a]
MSYPPYGQEPRRPQGSPPPQPPYGRQPQPQQPYGHPQQPPYGAPQQQPPYGAPQQPPQNPYGPPQGYPPPQNPYGAPPQGYPQQQPPPQYPQYPQSPQYPQNPYGGQQPPPQQPPNGGGPGGPDGPGSGGPGPGGHGGSGGGGRRRHRGRNLAILLALVVVVGGGAIAATHKGNSGGGTGGGGTGGAVTTTLAGGSSWSRPSWATAANDLGPADPSTVVTGTVYFAKASPQSLDQYATAVGTPGSSDYHKFLTTAQFQAKFVNTPNASQAVVQWIQQNKMTILSQDSESVVVRTTVGKVNSVLKIRIDRFRHDGRVDLSTTSQPQYPADIGQYISAVTGLTTSSPVTPSISGDSVRKVRANAAALKTMLGGGRSFPADGKASPNDDGALRCSQYYGQNPATGYPPGPGSGGTPPVAACGYNPDQLRSAYGAAASGLDGQGVTIAVVDAFASPTIASDVAQYDKQTGLPPLQLTQEIPAHFGADTTASDAQGWYGEETLDIEALHTMAPAAKIIYYAAQSDSAADLDAPLQTIVENHSAELVTCSWGILEDVGDKANFQAETQIFEQGAAEGISFNFSTGDNGDFTVGANPSAAPTVNEPADNPFATGVGGTTLGIGSQGQYLWETGWGDEAYSLDGGSWATSGAKFEGAGGGGPSAVFVQPPYQQSVVPQSVATRSGRTAAARVLPDVAMLASAYTPFLVGESTGTVTSEPSSDGMGVVYRETGASYAVQAIGGTSLASPLFTGMEALAVQASGSPLGFADPVLYKLYGTSQFRDVVASPPALGHEPEQVTGDSAGNPVLLEGDRDTSLRTTAGYDDTTGIGSPAPGFLTWFKDHPNGE